jgi:hypothetical protein
MKVIIEDHTDDIKRDFTLKANLFLRLAADEIVKESTEKTPMSDGFAKGSLRRNITKQVLGLTGMITWNQNYAIYQEQKQFKNYTTPGTGPHFAANAVKTVFNKTHELLKQVGFI